MGGARQPDILLCWESQHLFIWRPIWTQWQQQQQVAPGRWEGLEHQFVVEDVRREWLGPRGTWGASRGPRNFLLSQKLL